MFIIKFMLKYLADLVFDSREEYNFKSNHFKPRKFALFLLVCALLMYNVALTVRMFSMAIEYNKAKIKVAQYIKLEADGLLCKLDDPSKIPVRPKSIYELPVEKIGPIK